VLIHLYFLPVLIRAELLFLIFACLRITCCCATRGRFGSIRRQVVCSIAHKTSVGTHAENKTRTRAHKSTPEEGVREAVEEVKTRRWMRVLCCAVLCCAVLCCAVLCCAVLCCAVLDACAMLCSVQCCVRACVCSTRFSRLLSSSSSPKSPKPKPPSSSPPPASELGPAAVALRCCMSLIITVSQPAGFDPGPMYLFVTSG
jgi:hypothetical protein